MSKNIIIKSLRYGHANNSSSDHSFIFVSDEEKAKIKDDDTDEYGWNSFTLSSRDSKERYLISMIFRNFESTVNYEKRKIFIEKCLNQDSDNENQINNYSEEQVKLFKKICYKLIWKHFSDIFDKKNLKNVLEELISDSYLFHIDHQSVLSFPVNKYGEIEIAFIKELYSVILDNNFIILGGNDNGGEHPLENNNQNTPVSFNVLKAISMFNNYYRAFVVFDKKNNDWILQEKESGNKYRMSFEEKDSSNNTTTTKSGFPELVDLKITNYCNYGCSYCYQSSTTKGKHAITENIRTIVDILDSSNVMEIAIGGGEPTSHPDFWKILHYIRNKNIMTGFATRNYELHKHKDYYNILSNSNSIAFSCNTTDDVNKVIVCINEMENNLKKMHYMSRPSFYIQCILELLSEKELENISELCSDNRLNLTLLGYKNFGKGVSYNNENIKVPEGWIKTLKKYVYLNKVADSIIVKNFKKELLESGCDRLMLVGEEGKFSCYVDAVKLIMAPSSFTKENILKLNLNNKNILEEFSRF
jgi:MoaA/NifB/PqqE/SkfB family radical SAM enzyme